MLNINGKGKPIARVDSNDQIIYLDFNRNQILKTLKNQCSYCRKKFRDASDVRRHLPKCTVKKDIEEEIRSHIGDYGKEMRISTSQFIPLVQDYREVLFIAGPANSGKSYYANQYLEEYKKKFKGNDIYIFSKVKDDAAFKGKGGKGKKYLKVDIDPEEHKDNPVPISALTKSCCVFDDIYSVDKDLSKIYADIRNDCVTNGRDHSSSNKNDIYVVSTSHQIQNYRKTRDLLFECTSITIFPNSGMSHQVKKALRDVCGLNKHQIDKILGLHSRWVTVYTRAPRYVISQRDIYLL